MKHPHDLSSSSRVTEFLDKEGPFFARLYRLAPAITATTDFDSTMMILTHALKESIVHSTVVVLGSGSSPCFILSNKPVRRIGEESPHFDCRSNGPTSLVLVKAQPAHGRLMPVQSLALHAGIYAGVPRAIHFG
jgi:hypothetical protein